MHGTTNHEELDCPKFYNIFKAIYNNLKGYGVDKLECNDARLNTTMVFDTLGPILQEQEEWMGEATEVHAF